MSVQWKVAVARVITAGKIAVMCVSAMESCCDVSLLFKVAVTRVITAGKVAAHSSPGHWKRFFDGILMTKGESNYLAFDSRMSSGPCAKGQIITRKLELLCRDLLLTRGGASYWRQN